MNRLCLFLLALALILVPGLGIAQSFPEGERDQRVYDLAGFLPDATRRATLNRELLAFEETHGGIQVAVLTVTDTQGYTLEEYAHGVFRHWGIGQRGLNNGVLLLVSRQPDPAGHTKRIETGYGLEGELPDAICLRILRETMRPLMEANNPQGAIEAGARAILRRLGGDGPEGPLGGPTALVTNQQGEDDTFWTIGVIVVVIALLIVLIWFLVTRERGRSGGWSSGSSYGGDSWFSGFGDSGGSSGGSDFGGGDSGGGGASD